MTSIYKCHRAECRHNSIWLQGEPAYRCELEGVTLDHGGSCQEFEPEEEVA